MSSVQVAVRVRPPLPREINHKGEFHACVASSTESGELYVTTSDRPVLVDGRNNHLSSLHRFSFDKVFGETASNGDVYRESGLREYVAGVLRGDFNATLLTYGQTGSGKTYTVTGDEEEEGKGEEDGLALMCARDLIDGGDAEHVIRISYLEIYREVVRDLLAAEDDRSRARLRVVGGKAQGVAMTVVASVSRFRELLARGILRRRTACTALNTSSSRSHAVITFYIESSGGKRTLLHLVDLAGSERVKDSQVEGDDLRDAACVNLSLFNLARVIQALVERRQRVPFAQSALTSLLRESLSGEGCRTTLIATLSPAQLHARESVSTLNFASACSRVPTRCNLDESRREATARNAEKERRDAEKERRQQQRKAPAVLPWHNTSPPGGRITIKTERFGSLSCLAYGNCEHPLALCLHGHPSSAEDMYGGDDGGFLLAALVSAGFRAVALDMPGRGRSPGSALRTRSEFNLEKNGAADVVCEAIKALAPAPASKAVVIGYDWGGGIALSIACSKRHRRYVKQVVAFHPSFNQTSPHELRDRLSCRTMLIWCKQDQFHCWAKWRAIAAEMSSKLRGRYDEYVFSAKNWGAQGWSQQAGDVERKIVSFLTGSDPAAAPKRVYQRPAAETTTIDGERVTRRDNVVVLGGGVNGGPPPFDAAIFCAPDATSDALRRFTRFFREDALAPLFEAACVGASGPSKQEAMLLFANLPELSPATLSDPQWLVDRRIWDSEPVGWREVSTSPRYFPGRRVLIRAAVCSIPSDSRFMKLASASEERTTFRAVIAAVDEEGGVVGVDVESAEGVSPARLWVPFKEIVRLNHAQRLPMSSSNVLLLEDGIRCNYSSPLTRAKMLEIALRLAPIVAEMDFDEEEEGRVELLQRRAVRAIRGALGLVTFQRSNDGRLNEDGGHSRNRRRYCGDDAAKFAVNGQGHCHTCTSVMAAFLAPWCKLLGIDLKYRGGDSFEPGDDAPVYDRPESHQWLEFTTRPSCRSWTCDLYADDRAGGDAGLFGRCVDVAMETSYDTQMYPNGKLLRFGDDREVEVATVLTTDFSSER